MRVSVLCSMSFLVSDRHGTRVRLFDAVRQSQADYVDLRLTLRWAMMSQTDRREIGQVSRLYSHTTKSARRWFRKFLGQLSEVQELDADTLARWRQRLNRVGVAWKE